MKNIFFLFVLVFLISCSTEEVVYELTDSNAAVVDYKYEKSTTFHKNDIVGKWRVSSYSDEQIFMPDIRKKHRGRNMNIIFTFYADNSFVIRGDFMIISEDGKQRKVNYLDGFNERNKWSLEGDVLILSKFATKSVKGVGHLRPIKINIRGSNKKKITINTLISRQDMKLKNPKRNKIKSVNYNFVLEK